MKAGLLPLLFYLYLYYLIQKENIEPSESAADNDSWLNNESNFVFIERVWEFTLNKPERWFLTIFPLLAKSKISAKPVIPKTHKYRFASRVSGSPKTFWQAMEVERHFSLACLLG